MCRPISEGGHTVVTTALGLRHKPSTGSLNIPVLTVRPLPSISFGSETFTDRSLIARVLQHVPQPSNPHRVTVSRSSATPDMMWADREEPQHPPLPTTRSTRVTRASAGCGARRRARQEGEHRLGDAPRMQLSQKGEEAVQQSGNHCGPARHRPDVGGMCDPFR